MPVISYSCVTLLVVWLRLLPAAGTGVAEPEVATGAEFAEFDLVVHSHAIIGFYFCAVVRCREHIGGRSDASRISPRRSGMAA